jgi:P-type Ca2+ transporter type 2C
MRAEHPPAVLPAPHALPVGETYRLLTTSRRGLAPAEAAARRVRFGANSLPHAAPPGLLVVFARQFASPLIYILLAAAGVSAFTRHWSDAGFIMAVLALNAVIGAIQEYNAERSADALRALVVARARVVRDGEDYEIDAADLVPGDVALMEAGIKVPADVRLVSDEGLEVDESLLTGESVPVVKQAAVVLAEHTAIGDRTNMAFAGTLVTRGRAYGVVVETGLRTQLGTIAASMTATDRGKPPLLLRMERLSRRIAVGVAAAVALLGIVSALRGSPLEDVFVMAVALAVSAIPEGLPVALTVALAIGARRMAARGVIARRLVAVEALGSCTYIASDKTGTLTLNEQTVRKVLIPGEAVWNVSGEGTDPAGEVLVPPRLDGVAARALIERLGRAAALCNDGFLGKRDRSWAHHGDAVDVAMLVLAHKVGVTQAQAESACPRIAAIPFDPQRRFAAVVNRCSGNPRIFVKGAEEQVLEMCERMATLEGEVAIDRRRLAEQATSLAAEGFRVLAMAEGDGEIGQGEGASQRLHGLVLLGFVGMIDPPRPEAPAAMSACKRAGLEVAMVTGDHPQTALAIARELGLPARPEEVITGVALRAIADQGQAQLDAVVRGTRIFARVEPDQKLEIVRSLVRLGHFVAVTGDGANDAPALRAAHIGVAMGRRGTDVARESAELILTDDNFASIVAGIEEGRIAYANVRKVVFLLLSTGAAEILLFVLATASGLPLPLLPVQLLWLNLVTNGIQDVALAFEPGEGGELERPPRPPREPIFDRLMVERTGLSALVMGAAAFLLYRWLLANGWDLDAARNVTLLLLVLFENVQAGNSRSETRPVLRLSPLRNPLLFIGTLAALLIHVGAMHLSGLSEILGVGPVSARHWLALLPIALSLFLAVEAHKAWWNRRRRGDT